MLSCARLSHSGSRLTESAPGSAHVLGVLVSHSTPLSLHFNLVRQGRRGACAPARLLRSRRSRSCDLLVDAGPTVDQLTETRTQRAQDRRASSRCNCAWCSDRTAYRLAVLRMMMPCRFVVAHHDATRLAQEG